MKRTAFFCALLTAAGLLAQGAMPELGFNPPPREIKIGKTENSLVSNGKASLEIVVPEEAGETAKYAGEELKNYLQRACGAEIPLLKTRGDAAYAVILGGNALLKQAFPQCDPEKLPLEGFYILRQGGDIYIAGRDEKDGKIRKFLKTRTGNWWGDGFFDRGTLFGVYDFLERFAGVRFFFDGDMGTVVPKLAELKVPEQIHIMDRPDFTTRKVSCFVNHQDEWYDDNDSVLASNRNYLRWRLETRSIPNCHGLAHVGYPFRFDESHPEYFAMRADGKRSAARGTVFQGQLCLTNKNLREEIYKDVRSYLKGEPSTVRGVIGPGNGKSSYWASAAFQPGFVNVMPQDAFQPCRCPECQKYFSRGDAGGSTLIWEMTAEIANRLKAEKIPGYVTQMGYHFYSAIPDVELPDNVIGMVAVLGPWSEGKPLQTFDDKKVTDWNKKLKNKVALWNYCINNGKFGDYYSTPGMPHSTPRAVGKYYQDRRNSIYGAFLECETDHFLWGVPNIYIASKIFWNADTGVESLLDDFYGKMFGPAAGEIKQFFDAVEEKWLASRQTIETPQGPQTLHVSQYEVWTKYYPPKEVERLTGLFDQAEKKAAADPESLKRVRFFRKHFLNTIVQYAEKYAAQQNMTSEIVLNTGVGTAPADLENLVPVPGRTAYLQPFKGEKNDLSLSATAEKDDTYLHLFIRCQEPEMARLKLSPPETLEENFFSDALFEIFLNPSGDYRNYFHLAIHPDGAFKAFAYPGGKPWNFGGKVRTFKGKNFWSAEVSIPLKDLAGGKSRFPFNMSYNRQLKDEKVYSRTYSWSPFLKVSFHELDRFGLLDLSGEKDGNLVRDWNFDAPLNGDYFGAWYAKYPEESTFIGTIEPDSSTFISGGQSLRMRMESGNSVSASQNLKLKPDTKYHFSYWIRHHSDLTSGFNAVVNVGKNIFMPQLPISGNAEWHKQDFTFTTPKDFNGNASIRFVILRPKSEVWIDNVRLEEIK